MLDRANLHDYQRACVEHIVANRYCGVFLEMGLGKTVSTLTAIDDLMNDYCEINSVLVIAPKRVVESVWQEEAENWSHLKHLRFSKIIGNEAKRLDAMKAEADIYLISRDNVAWLCSCYEDGQLPFDMVVIDELSSFKSYKSQRFRYLRRSRPYFRRLVGLTGTPAPNSLIDLWPQIYLMDRGDRLGKTITNYRSEYFRPGKTNGHVVYNYVLREGSADRIYGKVGDICMSMKAEDYLKMPERTDNYIRLQMPDSLKRKYRDFEREKVLELLTAAGEAEITAINAGSLSNKLLQFANGAVYDEDKAVHAIHDIKLEALKEIVEDADGKPVLVAWTYQFDRDRIMDYLKAYAPRELKKPQDIKDWNAGKAQVLLAHPASAGHGLNLQAGGNIVVWYGQTWSLELYQQFNARLYRQGQKNSVIIHHLLLAGTHDEDVIRALKGKDEGQNSLMHSIKAKIERYRDSFA